MGRWRIDVPALKGSADEGAAVAVLAGLRAGLGQEERCD